MTKPKSNYVYQLYNKALDALKNKNYHNSLRICNEILVLDEDFPQVHHIKGIIYFAFKEYHKALKCYDPVLIESTYEHFFYDIAGLYLKLKINRKALIYYKKALKSPLYKNKVDIIFQIAYIYQITTNYEKAIKYYQKVIQLDPSSVKGYTRLGNIYFTQKNFEKALQNYKAIIKIDENCLSAYNNLSITYAYLKNYDKAIENYDKALSLDPVYSKVYRHRKILYEALQSIDKLNQSPTLSKTN